MYTKINEKLMAFICFYFKNAFVKLIKLKLKN